MEDASSFEIPVSVFENKDDTGPQTSVVSWAKLVQRLCRYDERLVKDGRAWSPVTYKPGTRRGKANVEYVYALVLDIDHGDLPRELLVQREYVAHTTFRHTPEAPRWRVVLPLSRPINGVDWPGFWLRANAYFGGCVDPATKDSSRIFYLPSCPPGAQHGTNWGHGDLLDPDGLPEVPQYEPPPMRRNGRAHVLERGLAEWARRFAEERIEDLARMPRDSGRNSAANRLAFLLGGLAADGVHEVTVEWIAQQVYDACWRNGLVGEDGQRSVEKTIESGLQAGLSRAWSPADQEPPTRVAHTRTQAAPIPIRSGSKLQIDRMDETQPEPIDWLWRGRIARGKCSLLMGDPGMGKSLISHWMAAQVSVGGEWPDGGQADQGGAILFTIEDGLADTVKPRLLAAGADCGRIVAVRDVINLDDPLDTRMFALEEHIALLEELIEQEHANLVVMDPVTAYLGPNINAHKDSDVRRVLAPLQMMAERTGVALLLLMHLTKGSGVAALYRATGSIAFPAVCRVVLGVAPDPNDETSKRRLLLPIKQNLSKAYEGIGYRIETAPTRVLTRVSDEDQPPILVWDNEPVLVDATSALDRSGTPSETTAVAAVKQTLVQTFLSAGTHRLLTADCTRALRDNHNSTSGSVVDRAKKDLQIRSERDTPTGPWWWVVPPDFFATFSSLARAREGNLGFRDSGNVATSPHSPTFPSTISAVQSQDSTESQIPPRAREGWQTDMRYCPACSRNMTDQEYEQHLPCVGELCPVHHTRFDLHDCDQL